MTFTYHNFDVLITPDEQIHATSKTEGEVGPVRLQLDSNQIDLALQLIEREAANPALVQETGKQLYQALFPAPILAHFERSRVAAPQRRLRLRLWISSPRLAALPWEFMFDGETFLGLSLDTPIIRYLETPQPIQSLLVSGPLRVLVVIASPVNYPDLNRESQAAALKTVFSSLQAEGILEVEFLPNATYAGLLRRLRSSEFHILHYLGYSAFDTESQQAALLFEEENGVARRITGSDLAGLLYREDLGRVIKGNRSLRLVVINDCELAAGSTKQYSVDVATSLVGSGIPAAVAMQYDLPDTVARTFAAEFYAAIGRGLPIDAAVAVGRSGINTLTKANDDPPEQDQAAAGEWASPILFMRAEDGQLFQPRQVAQLAFNRSIEQVYTGVETFKVETRDPVTRIFLDQLRAIIVICIAGLLAYGFSAQRVDTLFISGAGVILCCLWLLRKLFREQVPDTLKTLWLRKLILPRDRGNLTEQYLAFLQYYNALLNNQRYVRITQALAFVVVLYTLFNLNFSVISAGARVPLQALVFVLAPLAGYVVGTLLWKMLATVIATRQLSYRFDLDIRPNHPDGCGGLKPLGDLYFAHAWIVLIAGLFFAAWVFILSASYGFLASYVATYAPAQDALLNDYPALCGEYLASNRLPSTQVRPGFTVEVCSCLDRMAGPVVSAPRYLSLHCVVMNTLETPVRPQVRLALYGLEYYRWLESYQALLVLVGLIAIFTFVFPMYNTHRTMRGQGPRIRHKADSTAGEIAELERYIDQYGASSDEESNQISHRLEWLAERYQQYCNPPMWPFDTRVRVRLAGSLVTMVVALLLSAIIPDIVTPVMRSLL